MILPGNNTDPPSKIEIIGDAVASWQQLMVPDMLPTYPPAPPQAHTHSPPAAPPPSPSHDFSSFGAHGKVEPSSALDSGGFHGSVELSFDEGIYAFPPPYLVDPSKKLEERDADDTAQREEQSDLDFLEKMLLADNAPHDHTGKSVESTRIGTEGVAFESPPVIVDATQSQGHDSIGLPVGQSFNRSAVVPQIGNVAVSEGLLLKGDCVMGSSPVSITPPNASFAQQPEVGQESEFLKHCSGHERACPFDFSQRRSESTLYSRRAGPIRRGRKPRNKARKWSPDEQRRFEEGLDMYGRDWEQIARHVQTRDISLIRSHAQKHFIKLAKYDRPLPRRVLESGSGYTLSGNPLRPDGPSARSYLTSIPAHVTSSVASSPPPLPDYAQTDSGHPMRFPYNASPGGLNGSNFSTATQPAHNLAPGGPAPLVPSEFANGNVNLTEINAPAHSGDSLNQIKPSACVEQHSAAVLRQEPYVQWNIGPGPF